MGRIEAGEIAVGDEITVLPSGRSSKVKEIVTYDGKLQRAYAPQSVTLTLEDEIDISRGDMFVSSSAHPPRVEKEFEAMLCWLSETPLDKNRKYLVKHTTRTAKCLFSEHRLPRGREHAGTARDRQAQHERHRARGDKGAAAAGVRQLCHRPRHRQLHRDRRGDEQYRCGGDDRLMRRASRGLPIPRTASIPLPGSSAGRMVLPGIFDR